ncbi:transcriptional repressor [Streptomyces sp. S3(2020)]|uniref:transcriptional repressor n=1 Tax=Streptomyces sp. S3(2020) TaxID=2732044 RepID=UPI001488E2E9|nr:transcriptional repressor [Streptomyces sp. S3(2020)]
MSVAPQTEHDRTAAPDEPRVRLRRLGLRCTPARLRVLMLLADSGRHLSIAEAWAELARSESVIHPATVYRTLETLTAAGLVHAVHGPGPARYGLTGEPHHHTVCRKCGHVEGLASLHLTEAVGRIEELTGLRPDSSGSLLVYGWCADCGD